MGSLQDYYCTHLLAFDATNESGYVAADGWEDVPSPWNCTTCKKYVKVKHLLKLCPRDCRSEGVEKQASRGEIKADNCESEHFRIRYHKITTRANSQNKQPHIMLISNMVMVWTQIVLHKRVDYRTTPRPRTWQMHRD